MADGREEPLVHNSLKALSYAPAGISSRRLVALAVAVFFSGVALLIGGLLLIELTTRSLAAVSLGYVAFLLVALFMSAGLVFVALQIKSFSVRDGLMTLSVPLRLNSGRRVKSILLSDITKAEAATIEGYPGVTFALRDGTTFHVPYDDLAPEGREFLYRMVSALARQ